jgi:DtxR family Mn-dependent transcriptional regulator
MTSISVENYLKALYHLSTEHPDVPVRTRDLAASLAVTLPSATSMLKTLSDSGWVDYAAYQGARLTDSGRVQALRVIRNHRVIETFLVATLGYGWDEVHAEAERLEHAVSDDLVNRMDAWLGHPEVDPHGDPIPRAGHESSAHESMPLDQAPLGAWLSVSRVLTQEAEPLRYLAQCGIVPGAELRVVELLPFDGPVRLAGDDSREILLGRALAARVLCRADRATAAG